nr:MAG TPA: tail tape measure [Caudoviricetes sp.]
MAGTYKKTIVLGLDYSQFTGGTAEVSRHMGLLNSEFKRAYEEAKVYGTETDQLRIKHDYLSQKIELQKRKVEEAQKAHDKAILTEKEGSRAVVALSKSLADQETALYKLEGQLKETDKKCEDLKDTNETFGDSIRNVADAIGLQANPMLESLASRFDDTKKEVGEAIVIVGALVTAYGDLAIELSKTADNLLTMSSTTGLSTDTLQELQYASEFVDVSVETVNSSMTKMIRTMGQARDGNKDLQKEFARLGVRYKEHNGELRNSEDVFYDLIDALGKVQNETDRDAKAMDIFGRSARELNPLIEAGSGKLRELAKEAHKMGYVLSNETLQEAGALDDAMQRMNRKMETLKLHLGEFLVPLLTNFVDLLSSIPTPVLIGIAVFGTLVLVIGSVSKAVMAYTVASNAAAIANTMMGATGGAATAGMLPLLLILLAIAAAIALIVGGASAVGDAMREVKTSTEDLVNTSKSTVSGTKYYASGTDYATGEDAWVGEHGPELVRLPRGSSVMPNNTIKNGTGTVNVFYCTIDARDVDDFNRVVKLAQQESQAYRTGRSKI